jgi:hypothetical protein
MAKHKRGTRFVDWQVQGELIGRTVCHWACFSVAAFAMVFVLHVMGNVATGNGGKTDTSVLREMWDRYGIVVIALVSLLPYFCLDLILWSHRFVGPMVRIRRSMHDLAAGKSVSPIRLRAGDYWNDLADDFNRLQQRIESTENRANAFQAVMLDTGVDAHGTGPSDATVVAAAPSGTPDGVGRLS